VILFSHHQPFALLDSLEGKKPEKERNLVRKLAPLLERHAIHAWYFGHVHQCVIHDDHPAWKLKARCVGHSGFPDFRPKILGEAPAKVGFRRFPDHNYIPGGLVLDGPNQYSPGEDQSKYVPHGFVMLHFDKERVDELYFEAGGGQPIRSLRLA
jgi:hypothetical protein